MHLEELQRHILHITLILIVTTVLNVIARAVPEGCVLQSHHPTPGWVNCVMSSALTVDAGWNISVRQLFKLQTICTMSSSSCKACALFSGVARTNTEISTYGIRFSELKGETEQKSKRRTILYLRGWSVKLFSEVTLAPPDNNLWVARFTKGTRDGTPQLYWG